MELEWLVLSFVCFVLSDLLNRIWEDRGSSWQELGCSGHLSSLHHQLVMHLSPQNVSKMSGQGLILIGAGMFRTPIFIAWSTFVKHLSPKSVIFPVKMTPIHKVWSWSLGGQGVILTGAGMFRTPVFIVLSRCHGQKSVCIGLGSVLPLEKFSGGGWHSENNISSWSRSIWFWIRIRVTLVKTGLVLTGWQKPVKTT